MNMRSIHYQLRASLRRAARRVRGLNEQVVTWSPPAGVPVRGRVLLSYIIDGVRARDKAALPHSHTHFWETRAMATIFRDEGYVVDVIHWTRRGALPRLDYDIYVDVRRNFVRYARQLPDTCLKIAHMDTAHHRVHNGHQRQRLQALQARRGITLAPVKLIEENEAAEQADLVTVLGNEFTMESYAGTGTPVRRIPLSNAFLYPFPDDRNMAQARHRYLWLGSEGFVHKGLDLVLEAFAGMPDHELTVCGPLESEPAFLKAFATELYQRPNIHVQGWIDVGQPAFQELTRQHLGFIYPSCSEGGGGCVLTAMHAGLIPVVTRAASVDVDASCGRLLPTATVAAIQETVHALSAMPVPDLLELARTAWARARQHHTRDQFIQSYRKFVRSLPETLAAKRTTKGAHS